MFNLVIIWRFLFEFAAGRLLVWGSGSPAEMLLVFRASLQSNFPLQQKFGCQEILFLLITLLGLPAGSVVKNLPAMLETQETWVQFLGWEDSLE